MTPLLILAGGKATRLGAHTVQTPKFLLPIQDGYVFADFQLQRAAVWGFRDVLLSLGHFGEQIRKHCGDGSRWGLRVTYCDDGSQPLGTGGAVLSAMSKSAAEIFAVTYGDTLLSITTEQIREMELLLQKDANREGLMTVFENKVPGHQANAKLRENTVLYDKQHPEPDWNHLDYGFLFLRTSFVRSWTQFGTHFDLADPLSAASKMGRVLGYEIRERFWEIGTPEALEEFRKRDFLREFGDLRLERVTKWAAERARSKK